MAAAEIWSRFQHSPSVEHLTEDATLTYVTSCKQFSGAREIVSQLGVNVEGLKQMQNEVTCTHEAGSSLVSEVAASFVFDFEGKMNPFLPGLDDNMFSGKRVQLPIVYTVTFRQDKIHAVRVFWDQATVLKQIDVIGSRGRGWPVWEGAEQLRFLREGAKPEPVGPRSQEGPRPTSATNDPHASLRLFEHQAHEPRKDYGPQDYPDVVKPSSRDQNELFVNEGSARPDEAIKRPGQGAQRVVSLSHSRGQQMEGGMRDMSLNESFGQAGRSSHFEFGTPDQNDSEFKKNEIPQHRKGGIQDHNQSTQGYYEESLQAKSRPDMTSHFQLGGSNSPSPALQAQKGSVRGPPEPSFDAFSEQAKQPANIHDREYNMSRRPPPQAQYELVGESATDSNVHGMQYNAGRRAPPSAQYEFVGEQEAENNVHGMQYNTNRRPPPQPQYEFASYEGDGNNNSGAQKQSYGRSSASSAQQRQFTPTEQESNIHGREYNMSRRPPPQAQYDLVGDEAAESNVHGMQYNTGRRAPPSAQYEFVGEQAAESNVHGMQYNTGRRAPPSAQYDLVGGGADATPGEQQQRTGRAGAGQRNFSGLSSEADNVHGRAYNMSRRGPPSPQNRFME